MACSGSYKVLYFLLEILPPPFTGSPPTFHDLSKTMPDARTNAVGGRASRELGSLFDSELWWRDRYRELESRGYRLRPRYRPDWEPSWRQSGVDFYTVEDGQPTLVSVVSLMPSMAQACLSCLLRWTQYARITENKSCSRAFLREEDSKSWRSPGASLRRTSGAILATTACPC